MKKREAWLSRKVWNKHVTREQREWNAWLKKHKGHHQRRTVEVMPHNVGTEAPWLECRRRRDVQDRKGYRRDHGT